MLIILGKCVVYYKYLRYLLIYFFLLENSCFVKLSLILFKKGLIINYLGKVRLEEL